MAMLGPRMPSDRALSRRLRTYPVTQDDGAFDDVLQLSDVAWPVEGPSSVNFC
jgi:hypothetical protein